MNKSKEESLAQGQEYSVQFMVQQLYTITMMMKWTMPETFKDHYLYLGPFHTKCSYCIMQIMHNMHWQIMQQWWLV